MVRAIVTRGQIRPVEPLPADWQEGQSVLVEKADIDNLSAEEIDRDFALLATMCSTSDVADEEKMESAITEARRQAKEQVRGDLSFRNDNQPAPTKTRT